MAEVWVQFPLGALDFRTWESLAFRVPWEHEIAGSNPAVLTEIDCDESYPNASVLLGEQPASKPGRQGSTPCARAFAFRRQARRQLSTPQNGWSTPWQPSFFLGSPFFPGKLLAWWMNNERRSGRIDRRAESLCRSDGIYAVNDADEWCRACFADVQSLANPATCSSGRTAVD